MPGNRGFFKEMGSTKYPRLETVRDGVIKTLDLRPQVNLLLQTNIKQWK